MVGVLFFVDAILRGMPLDYMIAHLLLAIGVFLFCALLFAAHMLGGGDAKLAAVIFLWVSVGLSLPTLTLILVIGSCLCRSSALQHET